MKKVSIIIPVYNEEKTISKVLDNILKADHKINREIILVDDGSKDNSKNIINDYIRKNSANMKLFTKKNGGKGSAIRLGFKKATGDIILIQDADLEYNPNEHLKLMQPILDGKEEVVYGSRFMSNHDPMYKIYYLGNKFLSFLTATLYGQKITDMETCYKVFRADIIKAIPLKANKFDIEPEMTAKILKMKIKIKEIPISYNPRSIEEGKKIGWKDGVQAIWTLFKLKISN